MSNLPCDIFWRSC